MLKIFKIEGSGHYAGGVVLVAAHTAEEAAMVGNSQSSRTWNVGYDANSAVEVNNIVYSGGGNEPTLILHYEMGE